MGGEGGDETYRRRVSRGNVLFTHECFNNKRERKKNVIGAQLFIVIMMRERERE